MQCTSFPPVVLLESALEEMGLGFFDASAVEGEEEADECGDDATAHIEHQFSTHNTGENGTMQRGVQNTAHNEQEHSLHDEKDHKSSAIDNTSNLPSVDTVFMSVTHPEYIVPEDGDHSKPTSTSDTQMQQQRSAPGGISFYNDASQQINAARITEGTVLREYISQAASAYLAAEQSKLLRDIATHHGVYVNVERPRKRKQESEQHVHEGSKVVEVMGEEAKARAALRQVMQHATAASKEAKRMVRVRPDEIKHVIGKDGANIRRLQSMSGATIHVQQAEQASTASRTITIRGAEAACERAKELIQQAIGQQKH